MNRSSAVLTVVLAMTCSFALAQEEAQEQPRVFDHWSPYEYPTSLPPDARVHLIVKGDTLWDLAERFYGNPLVWPQIHNANPYISDPHWIYPDDPLVLPGLAIAEAGVIKGEPEATESTQRQQESGEPVAEPQPLQEAQVSFEDDVIFETEPRTSLDYQLAVSDLDLYCSAVIYPEEPNADLWIAGLEEKDQLEVQQFDIVYLNKGSGRVNVGDKFIAARRVGVVKHPDTGERVGYAYQESGILTVLLVAENHSVAEVISACDGLETGAMLIPFETRPNPVVRIRRVMTPVEQYTEYDHSEAGSVVYNNFEGLEIAAGDVIAINLGTRDGLKVGDRYFVLKARQYSRKNMYYKSDDDGSPSNVTVNRVIGEIVVFRLTDSTATAKVIFTSDFINLGDVVIPARQIASE